MTIASGVDGRARAAHLFNYRIATTMQPKENEASNFVTCLKDAQTWPAALAMAKSCTSIQLSDCDKHAV